VFSSSLKLTGT